MAERRPSPRSDFLVEDEGRTALSEELMFPTLKSLTEADYQEPNVDANPPIYPLGTIFIEEGRRRRIIVSWNDKGHALAADLEETKSGKPLINPRAGGTPDQNHIHDIKKKTMKRKKFLRALKRGIKKYMKEDYSKEQRNSTFLYIEEQWKRESTHKNKRRGKK